MNLYLLISLSILNCIICIDNFPIDNETLILTDSSIKKAINQFENLVIFFSAPWCYHCKSFEPEYHKAAKILKQENIYLALIDSSSNNESVKNYQINGFPTILFFKKGTPYEFQLARSQKELINWARKKSGIFLQLLDTKNDLENFKSNNDICLVYFGNIEEEIKRFTEASKLIEEYPFGIVKDQKLIKKYSCNNTIKLYKHFDEKELELKNFNIKKILDFIKENALPKVMVFNDKSVQYIFQKKNPALILYEKNDTERWNYYGNIITQVSQKIKGKMVLVMTDIKEGIASKLAEYVGITKKDLPLVSILDTRNEFKKYNMKGEITVDNILKFIDDWEQNKLKRSLKSEKEPITNNEDIFIVVGKSYEKEIINNDKDVMVVFYAPWCHHCKEFLPKYEEIAKILKGNNKLLLAKIDGSSNEVENVLISGFPTILFYPGNKKHEKPIQYNGKRTAEDIIRFIKRNAFNKINDENKDGEEENNEKNVNNRNKKENQSINNNINSDL